MPTAKKKTFVKKSTKKSVGTSPATPMPDTNSPVPSSQPEQTGPVINQPSHWESQPTAVPQEPTPPSPQPVTPPAQPVDEQPVHMLGEVHTVSPATLVTPDSAVPVVSASAPAAVSPEPVPPVEAEPSAPAAPAPTPTPAETPIYSSFQSSPSVQPGGGSQPPLDGSQFLSNTGSVVETKSRKGLYLAIVFGLLLLVAAGGGYYLYSKYKGSTPFSGSVQKQEPVIAEVTPSAEETAPTPASSSATPAVGKLKVRVLNGTTTKGLAAKVATLLEEKGFKNITTGNATDSGMTKTSVSLGKDVPTSVLDQVKLALGTEYQVVAASESATKYDVDIVVGK